ASSAGQKVSNHRPAPDSDGFCLADMTTAEGSTAVVCAVLSALANRRPEQRTVQKFWKTVISLLDRADSSDQITGNHRPARLCHHYLKLNYHPTTGASLT